MPRKKKREKDRGREENVQLQGEEYEDCEVVDEQARGGEKELKVAYTNVDRILSAKIELEDYPKENEPDVIGLKKKCYQMV